MRATLAAFAALSIVAGCAERTVEKADVGQVAPEQRPCENTVDAIGFTCTDGLAFSVRYDVGTKCVVMFLYDNTLVLPYDEATDTNTNGAVTFERRGGSATLSRITSGAASQCEVVE
jgi:hypothetical protein